MNTQTNHMVTYNRAAGDRSGAMAMLAEGLLPVIARKKIAAGIPVYAGSSFFYEVGRGWESEVLRTDSSVTQARDTLALEEAFMNPAVKAILIPEGSAISKTVALRICRRHGLGKTVFYEVNDHE